jgi:AraC family transcriptional regulator
MKPPVVDLTRENASLQIFSSNPFSSSREAGWDRIQVESFVIPAHHTPEHSPKQNAIIVFHQPLEVRRLLGGKFRDEKVKAGDFVLGPSNVAHSACWNQEASFTVVSIEQQDIAYAAHEFINPDLVEALPCFAQSDPLTYGIVQMLNLLLESGQPISQMCIDSLLVSLATRLLDTCCLSKPKLIKNSYSLSDSERQRVIDYIHSRLDKKIGIPELAGLLSMSDAYFSRLFKNSTGFSPLQYVIELRLKTAAYLLVSTNLGLGEIARRTGYLDQRYLARAFCGRFLIRPCDYRRRS